MTSGRKELLATIEHQRDKISKYEAKISDLVRAYKSLVKEKDALQASLSILSSEVTPSHNQSAKDATPKVDCSSSEENDSHEKAKEPSADNEGTVDQAVDVSLQNKVATLTSTLQTLADEKNKLEQSTKTERKRILEEKKQFEDQLKSESEEWDKMKKDYETKLQDLRSKIIVFQHEREKEASNGIMMLREVENRLSKERNERERIEKLLEETQEQNRQFALAIGSRSQEKKQQKQIIDLQNELEQVRCRLKKAEEQCNEPPMLKILQDQMDQMKFHYMDAILKEQKRAEAAEESVRNLSQAHEDRVIALESSLSELSVTAAQHDKTKRSYIETIHDLKEKIAELKEENANLKTRSIGVSFKEVTEKTDSDGESLKSTLESVWRQLLDLKEFESEDGSKKLEELLSNSDVLHSRCIQDYKVLENKLEEIKKGPNKEEDGSSCRCGFKEQTEDLRERIRSLNHSSQMTQDLHERQVTSLKEEISKLRQTHEEKVQQTEQEHKVTVAHLEQQLAEHCQRSLMTLQDRDEEIHRLTQEINKLNKDAQTQPSTVAAALLSQVSIGGSEGPLLHHLEDLARKEIEVSQLRKAKILLEKSMRDIQMTMIEKQESMQDVIDDLQEEVERLKRNTSREGENLEYLKNVVLQYMTCVDGEARLMILKAIGAVLKFTPEEMESVHKCLALWWWQAPERKKSAGSKRRSPSVSSGVSSSRGFGAISNVDDSFHHRNRFFSESES